MLRGIHFLLTYACNFRCDHCFLHCGPDAEGTFTLAQIRDALQEATRVGTIESVYFEGGEPFLYYPLMVEGVRMARDAGFQMGVVTNTYWATSAEDAELCLKPLLELDLADLTVSDDAFHHGEQEQTPAKVALAAAEKLGLPAYAICIEKPTVETGADKAQEKGAPVIGGGAMFRGRAAEKLVEGLPRRPWDGFTTCPYEDLKDPARVHLDPYGHVHICQGLTMGNMWDTPLSTLVKGYEAGSHPVCGPLLKGGPARLAEEYQVERGQGYVDACHLCYLARLALIDTFPQYLAPRQVYGLE